jgi:hypothetical protein
MSNFITNAFSSLFSHLTGLGSEAWHYIQENIVPILKHDALATLPKLAPIAEAAVIQVATSGKPGVDKFNDAKAIVKQQAIATGLDVAEQLFNSAVQLAHDKLAATGQLPSSSPAGAAPVNPSVPTPPAATN